MYKCNAYCYNIPIFTNSLKKKKKRIERFETLRITERIKCLKYQKQKTKTKKTISIVIIKARTYIHYTYTYSNSYKYSEVGTFRYYK